ncbi:VirK/YbjX family protein [Gallaecimonas kandeliae]|uniref:VirK/YbjX family protein n=1 Tax=Gallaecimonas kandeliae TaxID=3029055 RepID=UPI0026480323|nr:VirK/YbjX family protein [Gallaecimonas kandeliae]WKE66116.1 VirK/YbjX family protein [Gallaecimonas kandeliae]
MQYLSQFSGRSALARLIYPGTTFYAFKKRLLFCGRSLVFGRAYRQTLALSNSPHFQPVLQFHPKTVEKAFRPYLMRGLSPGRRFARLASHYRLLAQHWDSAQLTAFLKDGVTLASIEGPDGRPLEVRLQYLSSFQREGELTLTLVVEGEVFYSSTFILGEDEQGRTGLLVGGLQGPVRGSALDEAYIRDVTRHCHGVRPKALMVQLLSILAQAWGCDFIHAVSNEGHVFASRRYRRKQKLKTDYDSLWAEYGGEALEARLWQLPLVVPRKPLEEVASKKRSQYRKRYEWLDALQEDCRQSLG